MPVEAREHKSRDGSKDRFTLHIGCLGKWFGSGLDLEILKVIQTQTDRWRYIQADKHRQTDGQATQMQTDKPKCKCISLSHFDNRIYRNLNI